MKIAIVAPAPVPYIVGGAENLYHGLCKYYNEKTPHSCEIIALPSPEGSFEEIISSYRKFSKLNLDRFDLVISTKYPSWMISHRNHVCYMLHTLRGLYDTYHLMKMPNSADWSGEELSDLKSWMDRAILFPKKENEDLDFFFHRLEQILAKNPNKCLTDFPGPFVREIIHFLDSYALSEQRVKKHFAISSTVANRENYFPNNINVSTLYPAPLLENFRCGEANYFFTASRLDSPKRIDLIINAFKLTKNETQLIIAGDGPEFANLKKLAKGDKRIKFVGRVIDDELLKYYSDALAIVYVPYEEDYGYITIEAMKSSKPVITTIDSGGPNEFVQHDKNGFSVAPKPRDIAKKMDFLAQNVDVARKMGARACRDVQNISWRNTAEKLLNEDNNDIDNQKADKAKQKMVVVVTFPIYPPRGGGQSRIFNLYSNLTKYYDIEIVCLCGEELSSLSREIAPGLIETRVSISNDFADYSLSLSKKVDYIPVTDIAAIEGYKFVDEFKLALGNAVKTADIVVASHPFLIDAIMELNSSAEIWFEAHNVEFDLKTQLLPDSKASKKMLDLVHKAEKHCWLNSELIFACTSKDLVRLEELYGKTKAKKIEVPNGVDINNAVLLSENDRKQLKERLGVGAKNTVLFMGSWHGPNLEAAERLILLAHEFPDVFFFLIGSAGLAFEDRELPSNIIIFGELDEEEKRVVMCASDVAVNPMISGSGSNLKMLDFFAYGIPVISTAFGARGILAKPSIHFIESDINGMKLELNAFFALHTRYEKMRESCRELVMNYYSWDKIADEFQEMLISKLTK